MHAAAATLVKCSLGVVSVFLAVSAASCRPQWTDVSSEEGAFLVRMPTNVRQGVELTGTPYGPLPGHSWTASELEGDVWNVYSIVYVDLPASVAGRAETLHSMGEWRAKGWGGQIEAAESILLHNWPGTDSVVSLEGEKRVLWCRSYLVGRRFFELVAGGSRENAGSQRRARRFLESFTLMASQ